MSIPLLDRAFIFFDPPCLKETRRGNRDLYIHKKTYSHKCTNQVLHFTPSARNVRAGSYTSPLQQETYVPAVTFNPFSKKRTCRQLHFTPSARNVRAGSYTSLLQQETYVPAVTLHSFSKKRTCRQLHLTPTEYRRNAQRSHF